MHSLLIGFWKQIRGKGLSKNKPTCENAVSQTLYGSCSLRVMGSCICIVPLAIFHPHFIIRIFLSAFYHPHFFIRIFLSAFYHPPSAIRHPPPSGPHFTETLYRGTIKFVLGGLFGSELSLNYFLLEFLHNVPLILVQGRTLQPSLRTTSLQSKSHKRGLPGNWSGCRPGA